MTRSSEATVLLQKIRDGDVAAAEKLLPLVYDELHQLAVQAMAGEKSGHTLQPTALVHEAYLRLVESDDPRWEGRRSFLAVAARAMRNVLVDHARAKKAGKRGKGAARVPLDDALQMFEERSSDLLELDEALVKLDTVDEQLAKIVELRFFGGLTCAEAGKVLEISTRSVERGWTTARAWLYNALAS